MQCITGTFSIFHLKAKPGRGGPYYMPATVVEARNTALQKKDENMCHHNEATDNKQNAHVKYIACWMEK